MMRSKVSMDGVRLPISIRLIASREIPAMPHSCSWVSCRLVRNSRIRIRTSSAEEETISAFLPMVPIANLRRIRRLLQ